MTFQPQQFLGRELPGLIDALAQVDPAQLPPLDQGRVQLHDGVTIGLEETLDAARLRPQAYLPTVVDSHLPLEHPDITVPDVVLESYLGGGSQGWVYSGQVRSTGKVVAVKVIRSDFEDTRRAVAREARICRAIRHYNVLRVFEVQSTGAFWVVLMELVQGEQLGKRPLDDRFRTCFAALADAVFHLGARGIVHRDIKPANILLRHHDRSPVLVDFGLALDLNANEERDTARICGTPLFLAPEAFLPDQPPTPAWDAYALGVTAAVTLLGKIPGPTALDTLWESKRTGAFQSSLHQSVQAIEDGEIRDWIRGLTAADAATRISGLDQARRWLQSCAVSEAALG